MEKLQESHQEKVAGKGSNTSRLSRRIDADYEAYKVGEPDSAGSLYRAFRSQARNVIWHHLTSRDEALEHDIAQRAMSALGKFHGQSRLSTWFYAIAQNEVRRALRRHILDRKRLVPLAPQEREDWSHGSGFHPLAKPINHDAALDLEKLAHRLSAKQAEVLELSMEGHSLEEIARKTGAPLGTIRSRYHLAKRAMKAQAKKNSRD